MEDLQFKDFDIMDVGNIMEISGVVYGAGESVVIIMLPWEPEIDERETYVMYPDVPQWEQILRQSDLKEISLIGKDKNKKVILRKSTRQIEQHIMWKVFRRDNFTCRYCGADEVPMTVDHVVLWEEMGPSIYINLITSCKKCNNTRGSMPYEEWLESSQYKRVSAKLTEEDHLRNQLVINMIPAIRENHMRVNKRSR
jgi:hypothetical protein